MEVVVGGTYRHFKGTLHKVIGIATHSETLEKLVIYTHGENNELWARPYELFTSKVDKKKYPKSKQEDRFEYIGE